MNKKIGLLLSLVMVGGMLTGCSKGLDVKNDMSVELGTPISTDIKDYLNDDAKDQDKFIQEGKLLITEDKKVEGKDYQPVGDYVVKITYDGKEAEVKVSVKDTVKPVFKKFKDSIDTYKDVKVDFSKEFAAEDLSKVTITADDSKVDYTKEGSYKATVTATDEAKNTETKEVTINVKKPEIKLDKTSKTLYEKESFVIKADVKGKDSKVTFKSSNNSIATVSDSGKVTAKKKGSAVITVEANGIKAECKITVKARANNTTNKHDDWFIVDPNYEEPQINYEPTLSRKTFDLLNAERTKRGVPALKWDNHFAEMALLRAKECTVQYSHLRPNGQWPSSLGIHGEILTGGYSDTDAVERWMNSSSHKENILNTNHTKGACAKVKSPDTAGDIWVAVFVW